MARVSSNSGMLPIIITVLALADGILHFLLDIILFRGNFFGSFGPPRAPAGGTPRPSGPPPGGPRFSPPLPLNELFVLNLIGYVVLIVLFWFGPRLLGRARWLIDILMILYTATVFIGWWEFGRPNPMGLGYLSKGIEILLVLTLIAHITRVVGERSLVRTSYSYK